MKQNKNFILSDQHFTLQILPPIHQIPYEKEKLLLSQLQNVNVPALTDSINDLLGYALFPGKKHYINRQSRINEVFSVFMRILIETGASDQLLAELTGLHAQIPASYTSHEEMYERLQDLADYFMQKLMTPNRLNNSLKMFCHARGYIARHYAGSLRLADAASYVHLNPAYFSTLFKQACGISFTEYLTRIRIARSCQLLAQTNDEILDIAIAVGFEDQSYFTKIFRKYMGQTPGQFRKKHEKDCRIQQNPYNL